MTSCAPEALLTPSRSHQTLTPAGNPTFWAFATAFSPSRRPRPWVGDHPRLRACWTGIRANPELRMSSSVQNHPLVSIIAATSRHVTFPSFDFHRLLSVEQVPSNGKRLPTLKSPP